MIAVVDYGMGNLRSVAKALERVGGEVCLVTTPEELKFAEKVILPGVGAFADAIARLRETGMDHALLETIQKGKPFLGICLGYQMLFETSFEHGEYTGLGVFPGQVVHFDFTTLPTPKSVEKLKIPHMGWNAIRFNETCPLFAGIQQDAYVYFVHSYYPDGVPQESVAAVANYGYDFTAAVWKDNVFATQFHPEKSQSVGLKMLENFVNL